MALPRLEPAGPCASNMARENGLTQYAITLLEAAQRAGGGDALAEAHSNLLKGDAESAAALARRGVEEARANPLVLLPWMMSGVLRCRVLRMLGPDHRGDLAEQLDESVALVERTRSHGWRPMLLAERAGLARLDGDDDAMARDLAEARRLWAEMGAQGWIDYSRSIEA